MHISVTTMSTVFKMCIKKDRDQVWKMSAQNGRACGREEIEQTFTTLTVMVIATAAIAKTKLTGDITALYDRAACF